MFQFYKIVDGAGSPLSDKQAFTGVFKPTTFLTIKVVGSTISAAAHNDVDHEAVSLEDTIAQIHSAEQAFIGRYPSPGETATFTVCSEFHIPTPKCPLRRTELKSTKTRRLAWKRYDGVC